MSTTKGSTGAIDGLVYDFYVLAVEGILQERKGITNPLTHSSDNYSDNADYNRHALLPWRKDVNRILVLDLLIFSTKHNKYLLLERWKLNYQRSNPNDSKEARPFPVINRRILTLVRTLACFLRLLPGFNLLNLSKVKPTLGYQIYEWKNDVGLPEFSYDCLKYKFNQVSTSKGVIAMSVTYINPASTKEILRSINTNTVGNNSIPRGINKANKEKSAAIPIPVQSNKNSAVTAVPDYNSYPASRYSNDLPPRRQHSMSYDQRSTTEDYEYADQFDSNVSSYTANAHGQYKDEDSWRRSQQQNRHPPQHTTARGHSISEDGPNTKGVVRVNHHQQASSLDHYSSKHSLLSDNIGNYFESSPSNAGFVVANNAPLPNMSPSSATASVQYMQNYARLVTPAAGVGGTAYANTRGGHHHVSTGAYPHSSASSQSTPPFSLLDQRDMIINSGYPDPTKASPPYPQFSTSLVSTSPASLAPSSVMMMMEMYRKKRRSFSERTTATSSPAFWQQPQLQQQSLPSLTGTPNAGGGSSIEEGTLGELRKLVKLPKSPFDLLLAANGENESDSGQKDNKQSNTRDADNNTLDVILKEERRKIQMQQPHIGWEAGDYTDESSRQFRLSDDRGRATQQLLDDVAVTGGGGDSDRVSLGHAAVSDVDDAQDEDDDMMFAFALNPVDMGVDGNYAAGTPHQVARHNNSSRSAYIANNQQHQQQPQQQQRVDSNGNTLYSAAELKEEMKARLDVFKAFKAARNI